jgi:uncharacterized protein GlcG (DUF336 family)
MITLKQSNIIIESALARARQLGLPPIGAAVLDAGGHLKAFQAEDGLNFLRVRVCQAKAWGALGLGVGSDKIAERYESGGPNPGFIDALNALSGGNVIPLRGGLLVHGANGALIGAVGVSGALPEQDEDCAAAGIAALNADQA